MQVSQVVASMERMDAWAIVEISSQIVVMSTETANLENGKQLEEHKKVPKNDVSDERTSEEEKAINP